MHIRKLRMDVSLPSLRTSETGSIEQACLEQLTLNEYTGIRVDIIYVQSGLVCMNDTQAQ